MDAPAPTKSLPENTRLPPDAPSSESTVSPVPPLFWVATSRLSVSIWNALASLSPGTPAPTVTTLLVKTIDAVPFAPGTPVAPGAETSYCVLGVETREDSFAPMPPAPPAPPSAKRLIPTVGAVSVL